MENPRNKSDYVKNKNKNKKYFERLTKLNVFSYTKPNDKKILLGAKPEETKLLFNGYANNNEYIDQSVLQYYIILGMQDLYYNYILPLEKENLELKRILIKEKDKNNQRFDYIMKHMKK